MYIYIYRQRIIDDRRLKERHYKEIFKNNQFAR